MRTSTIPLCNPMLRCLSEIILPIYDISNFHLENSMLDLWLKTYSRYRSGRYCSSIILSWCLKQQVIDTFMHYTFARETWSRLFAITFLIIQLYLFAIKEECFPQFGEFLLIKLSGCDNTRKVDRFRNLLLLYIYLDILHDEVVSPTSLQRCNWCEVWGRNFFSLTMVFEPDCTHPN